MLDANFVGSQAVMYNYRLIIDDCLGDLSINIEYNVKQKSKVKGIPYYFLTLVIE